MHELGYAFEIVKTLEEVIKENNLTSLSLVTVKIGEATALVPRYLKECWPAVIEDNKVLKNSVLNVEFIKAKGHCIDCDNEFIISESNGVCPKCNSDNYNFISGYEFEIIEIRGK